MGQALYFDATLKGFGVRVTRNSKTYIAQSRVTGKVCRYSIGSCEVFSAEEARSEAKKQLALMARGINPNEQGCIDRTRQLTLNDVFEDYVATRHLKDGTAYGYRKVLNRCFADWLDKPIVYISKDLVQKRHQELSTHKAQANLAMRILRAICSFASSKYEDAAGQPMFSDNPVRRLSQTKSWHRIPRRQTTIAMHDLKKWYRAVLALQNPTMRDYILLVLFTGLRRNEAAQLKWENVDLNAQTLLVPAELSKNHQPHLLPLSDFVVTLLDGRARDGIYVFSSTGSKQHLVDPRKAMAQVSSASGVAFTLHDLRRRFLTIAESLDIPHYALKRLANHRDSSDVTAGYIVADVERLREPMQKITDVLLSTVSERSTVDDELRAASS